MNNMENAQVPALPEYYTMLCHGRQNAIEAWSRHNYGLAREQFSLTAKQAAEEIVISSRRMNKRGGVSPTPLWFVLELRLTAPSADRPRR